MVKDYVFRAKMWLYPGKAGWTFVTVPKELSEDIDYYFADKKRGWGSLRVTVTVGRMKWKTSIFPDRKAGAYLLPVKKEVRRNEGLRVDDELTIRLEIGQDV